MAIHRCAGSHKDTIESKQRFGGRICLFSWCMALPCLEVKGCSVTGWLSLQVELCWGSAFLPQRLHPASAVQAERFLQRVLVGFAADWHGCRKDQLG